MKSLILVWLLAAAATAIGIAFDMRRLRVNYIWLSLTGWAALCACAGAVTAVLYLIMRQSVRKQLIDAAWQLIGDETHAPELRRKRLLALRQNGLVGETVFRACLRSLDASGQPSR